jgi:hypothetical protein
MTHPQPRRSTNLIRGRPYKKANTPGLDSWGVCNSRKELLLSPRSNYGPTTCSSVLILSFFWACHLRRRALRGFASLIMSADAPAPIAHAIRKPRTLCGVFLVYTSGRHGIPFARSFYRNHGHSANATLCIMPMVLIIFFASRLRSGREYTSAFHSRGIAPVRLR